MFFYLLLPENTPRIWHEDMERGYGGGIWNEDMHTENKTSLLFSRLRYGKMDTAGD
jgi:hypothetical protein